MAVESDRANTPIGTSPAKRVFVLVGQIMLDSGSRVRVKADDNGSRIQSNSKSVTSVSPPIKVCLWASYRVHVVIESGY